MRRGAATTAARLGRRAGHDDSNSEPSVTVRVAKRPPRMPGSPVAWRVGLPIRARSGTETRRRDPAAFTRRLGRYHAPARRPLRVRKRDAPMPELPDITAYLDALEPRVVGQPLEQLRIGNPFLVRTIRPEPADLVGPPRGQPASPRQADRVRVRGRAVHDRAPDDCRPLPLARSRRRASRQARAGRLRLPYRHAAASPRPAPSVRPRSTSSRARRRWPASTPAASRCSTPTCSSSRPG